MLRIKQNDKVLVIAGKDKGKTGKVLHVLKNENRAIVEGINMAKKARRRTQQEQQGGIVEIEMAIHLSNLMLVDKKNKPTRFAAKVAKDGKKQRVSVKGKEVL